MEEYSVYALSTGERSRNQTEIEKLMRDMTGIDWTDATNYQLYTDASTVGLRSGSSSLSVKTAMRTWRDEGCCSPTGRKERIVPSNPIKSNPQRSQRLICLACIWSRAKSSVSIAEGTAIFCGLLKDTFDLLRVQCPRRNLQ